MSKADLSRVYQTLAASNTKASIELQAVQRVSNTTFKIVASLANFDAKSNTEQQLAEAVASITDGRGRVVPGSVASKGRLAVAIVRGNAISKPFGPDFTMVTAATASAPDGKLWNVVNIDGAKRVVLESGDDLAGIFKERIARRTNHVNPAEGRGLATAAVANGDLVRFVGEEASQAEWGIAFNTTAGLQVLDKRLVARSVVKDLVIASVPRTRLPAQVAQAVNPVEAVAKLSPAKLGTIVDYMRRSGYLDDSMQKHLEKLAAAA